MENQTTQDDTFLPGTFKDFRIPPAAHDELPQTTDCLALAIFQASVQEAMD